MAIELVVYDYDGTLCDTRDAICVCVAETFVDFSITPPPRQVIADLVGSGAALGEVFLILLERSPNATLPRDLDVWKCRYRDIYASKGDCLIREFEGVREVLSFVHERGVAQAVVSNKGPLAIEASLTRLGIHPFIQLVVGDTPGVARKPHRQCFDVSVRQCFPDLAPSRMLMVGDSQVDLLFAANTGMRSCWASYGFGDPVECGRVGFDHRISTIRELISLIDADL